MSTRFISIYRFEQNKKVSQKALIKEIIYTIFEINKGEDDSLLASQLLDKLENQFDVTVLNKKLLLTFASRFDLNS